MTEGGKRRRSQEIPRQFLPQRICGNNNVELPQPRPMFDVLFPLDRSQDIVVTLHMDQTDQALLRREFGTGMRLVLPHTTLDVVRHAHVERAERLVRHDVDPANFHGPMMHMERLTKGKHDEKNRGHQ
jgi:hypothetical protein